MQQAKLHHSKSASVNDISPIQMPSTSKRNLRLLKAVEPLQVNFTSKPSVVRDLAGNSFKSIYNLLANKGEPSKMFFSARQTMRPGSTLLSEHVPQDSKENRDIKEMSIASKIKLLEDMGLTSMISDGSQFSDFRTIRNDKMRMGALHFWSAKELNAYLKKHELGPAFKALKRKVAIKHVRTASHQSLPSKPYIMDMNNKRRAFKLDANYFRTPDTYDTVALKQVTEPLTGNCPSNKALKLHQIMKDCDSLYSKTKQINRAVGSLALRSKWRHLST